MAPVRYLDERKPFLTLFLTIAFLLHTLGDVSPQIPTAMYTLQFKMRYFRHRLPSFFSLREPHQV